MSNESLPFQAIINEMSGIDRQIERATLACTRQNFVRQKKSSPAACCLRQKYSTQTNGSLVIFEKNNTHRRENRGLQKLLRRDDSKRSGTAN